MYVSNLVPIINNRSSQCLLNWFIYVQIDEHIMKATNCLFAIFNATLYVRIYMFPTYMWNTFTKPHHITKTWCFWPIKIAEPRHFSLKCLYQARKVSGNVYIIGVPILTLFLPFFEYILEFSGCVVSFVFYFIFLI